VHRRRDCTWTVRAGSRTSDSSTATAQEDDLVYAMPETEVEMRPSEAKLWDMLTVASSVYIPRGADEVDCEEEKCKGP
jgi:hypothetical protein